MPSRRDRNQQLQHTADLYRQYRSLQRRNGSFAQWVSLKRSCSLRHAGKLVQAFMDAHGDKLPDDPSTPVPIEAPKLAKQPALARLRTLEAAIEAQKQVLARERDKLRALISDVEEIVDNFDEADENITSGLRDLHDGVEAMSRHL